jgi:hypothetical protein
MADAMTSFSQQIQSHVKALEERLSTFNASLGSNIDYADKEIRHQISVLEGKAHSAKASAEASASAVGQWVADSVHSVEEWKKNFDINMLVARAERADAHAKAAAEVAMEAFFTAEKAALYARLAQADLEVARAGKSN